MGIFSGSSPFDTYVEKATNAKNTSDDWAQIMDVCDRVKEHQNGSKECLKAIVKRLSNDNPRVALQTITLLDACINNCGRGFLLEVASRDFEQILHKFITSSKSHPKVSVRLRESVKKWAAADFKGDPELGLIPAFYAKLVKEGCDFDSAEDSPKKTITYSNDPNVVHDAQEEEDIAKAIQLSLLEKGSSLSSYGGGSSSGASSGLYSNIAAALASDTPAPEPAKDPKKVRALYDFEAAEDNELSFKAGEIILILDDSDANWWKGSNHRGEGLFPANFVTSDADDEYAHGDQSAGKHVSFSDCVEVTEVADEAPSEIASEEATGEIDEEKIDRLLHLLHEADPTGERHDDPLVPGLEEQVNAMAPNIDAELECIDRKHAQLARLSTDLVDALNLYHQLMREMPASVPFYSPYKMMPNSAPGMPNMAMPPQFMPPGHPSMQAYPPGQFAYGGNPQADMNVYAPNQPPMMGVPPAEHMNMMGQPQSISQPYAHGYPPSSVSGPVSMPNYPQYPGHGLPQEYGSIPPNDVSGQGQNPAPNPENRGPQQPNIPQPQAPFPQNGPPQSNIGQPQVPFPQNGPPQSSIPQPQGPFPQNGTAQAMPVSSVPGPQAYAVQGAPISMPNSNQPMPAAAMAPQAPIQVAPIPHPQQSVPYQTQFPTMAQGPPMSMPYYPQQPPQMQQQPLL